MKYIFLFTVFVSSLCSASALRALGLFPIGAYSHNIMFKSLFEALALRGHRVVMMSPFPRKTPMANYTDIDISPLMRLDVGTFDFDSIATVNSRRATAKMVDIIAEMMGPHICRMVFASQQFQDIMAGKYGQFDVVFTEVLGADCFTAVSHKLKVPLIGMVSLPDFPGMHNRVGSVNNPSYIHSIYEDTDYQMNFFQRVLNTFSTMYCQYYVKLYVTDGCDEVTREFLGEDTPPLADIIRNTSLILVNRHVSVQQAVPVSPNVVHVGGLHVKRLWRNATERFDDIKLELKAWMDGADHHGVIVFTFGSMTPLSSFPVAALANIMQHLGKLPHRVVLKYENTALPVAKPKNVRVEKWVPQAQVLAHPKVVLFVTHCGLMGTQEAVTVGVPMICVPIFADQMYNAKDYIARGIGDRIYPWELPYVDLSGMISKMVAEGYLKRAREVARRFLDRQQTVEEEAVWWVEYVVRHRGAPHLRPLGADLPLHQYLLLDVFAFALLVALLALLSLAALLRWFWRKKGAAILTMKMKSLEKKEQ